MYMNEYIDQRATMLATGEEPTTSGFLIELSVNGIVYTYAGSYEDMTSNDWTEIIRDMIDSFRPSYGYTITVDVNGLCRTYHGDFDDMFNNDWSDIINNQIEIFHG